MCDMLINLTNLQSQASLFWAMSKMGLRPNEALLDKASIILQQKELRAQVRVLFFQPNSLWYASNFGLLTAVMMGLLVVAVWV